MKVAANFMDALTLHYYTHPGGWLNKGAATGFDKETWYISMNKTLKMEELINRHLEIMNKYNISPKIDAGVADLDLFVQDKLAFMSAGMWQVNALKNADFPVEDYDVVDLPIVKEDKAVIGVGGAPIFAASEHQDAAWEFAKFLSSKDFQDTFIVEDGWSIPAVKSAADTLAAKDFAPAHADLFYASAQKGVMVPAPQEYGAIESVLLREFGAAMANMKTMEEAMAAAEEEINAEIAKRG